MLSGTSTTLEARVFASPSNTATVSWYHRGALLDPANDARYTTSSSGDMYSLTVSSVSEAEVGEYTIVVSLNGVTANDTIMLTFPGMYKFVLCPLQLAEPLTLLFLYHSATYCHGQSIVHLCE